MLKNSNNKLVYPNVMSINVAEKIISAIKCEIRDKLDRGEKTFSVKHTFGYNTVDKWENSDNDNIKIIYYIYRSFYDGYDKLILNLSNSTLGRLLKITLSQMPESFVVNHINKTLVYTLEGDE